MRLHFSSACPLNHASVGARRPDGARRRRTREHIAQTSDERPQEERQGSESAEKCRDWKLELS
jgi:hypothetical protein